MRMFMFVIVSLLPILSVAEDWTPPPNPEPTVILQEAQADAQERRYETALAKHVWYHENAVAIDPGQSGVRLSFAMSYWLKLGEAYPPALKKMTEIRDETEEKIRDPNRVRVQFQEFHDFTALNKTLRQEQKTAELFRWVDETDSEDAARLYGISEPALIRAKEYELCGKYIQPEKDTQRIVETYTRGLESADRFGEAYQTYVDKKIVNDAATLVAILIKNDRSAEAIEVAEKFRTALENEKLSSKLNKTLDAAIDGVVPTPWP